MSDLNFSIKRINKHLIEEISTALKAVAGYGSVEIYIQDNRVVQITTRNIRKINNKNNGFIDSN